MEGLGGVEERVETRARDRRASRVHEAEDGRQFRGLHPGKDHRDGLAVGRRFAVREQHLLEKKKGGKVELDYLLYIFEIEIDVEKYTLNILRYRVLFYTRM